MNFFEQALAKFHAAIINTGLYALIMDKPANTVMIVVGLAFCYLAIVKHYEPYELLPIGLGIILINLPLHQVGNFIPPLLLENGEVQEGLTQNSGLLGIVKEYGLFTYNILPPLVFLGLGAITDFGPLIANPRMLLLGGAAQVGIFIAFIGALLMGFNLHESAAISIIGGADGPTTIYLNAMLLQFFEPQNKFIIGVTAVTAYSYMGLVPIIQPPIMRLLTSKEERKIHMTQLRHVRRRTKIIFPIAMMIVAILLIPQSAPLVSMFMIGNVFRESGVVDRLFKSSQNEILNVVTIFLMLSVGITLRGEEILNLQTMKILGLGLGAFACGTASGILFAKTMNLFSRQKINPLIGAAGVSAVPMASRVAQEVAYSEDHNNHLIMHAMGPNVAGVIGSAVVAGYFLSYFQSLL
ncbi:MAG: sodium ion-translocating decarboxylase subunit beta [bacterium]